MLFWISAALLTILASLAVLAPLTRSTRARPELPGSHDLEVYRDQFAELDRDAARGLIGPAEAELARAEIARRIIDADALAARAGPALASRRDRFPARLTSAAAVLSVPVLSWGVYAFVGSPGLPSDPLAARLAKNPADSSIEELVARAEAHLAANPTDARGWDVLAPIYVKLRRFPDAVAAYRHAMEEDGATADRESGLGEAIVAQAGGIVSAEARSAFERAVKLQANHPKASYYMALAFAQEGESAEAARAWEGMLAVLPPDSMWRAPVQERLGELRRTVSNRAPSAEPSAADISASEGMAAADRVAMIQDMVTGLDEKLRRNPDDREGWERLVRSYVVLGNEQAARDALARGTQALAGNAEAAGRFAAFARSVRLTWTD